MADRSAEEIRQRRERRAERRQSQRLANLQRAAKMHSVRVSEEHEPNTTAPAISFRDGIHIGCSGWYYWHWKGGFYPAEVPSSQWFSVYEQSFETVELNAPFWPTIATVKTWLRQATGDFIYTIKVCELIIHIRRFDETETLILDFCYIADLLGERMGCFLFQLPPSIRYDPTLLKTVLQQLDPRHRNVVEFRHKSWRNEDVYAAFRAAGVIFCSCSGPRLPDELVKTADDIYVRFHGTKNWYRHDYSDDELAIWAERIRASGAKNVWVYFNNDRGGHSIKNAKTLRELLSGNKGGMPA